VKAFPAAKETAAYYVRALAIALPAIMLGWQISGWIFFLPSALAGRADFRAFYSAGYMVRTGHAHELYDYEAQKQLQDKLTSPMYKEDGGKLVPVLLSFYHPGYEALFFAPLSLLSYKNAYFLFLAINLAALSLSFRLFRPLLPDLAETWTLLPFAMFFFFLPVGIALMQGQDSLFLLLFLIGSLLSLRRGSELWAGALVALASFKFQFTLPIAILFLCWRRWRFVGAFTATGAALAFVSVWLSGLDQVRGFIGMLLSHSGVGPDPNRLQLVVPPAKMMNVHGLLYTLCGGDNRFSLVLTFLLSVALLMCAGWAGRTQTREKQFAAAIVLAALVSYHMFQYDLALLLIPISLALNETISSRGREAWITALCALLFLAPAVGSTLAFLFVAPLCAFIFVLLRHPICSPLSSGM
jgi:hypothetical protein